MSYVMVFWAAIGLILLPLVNAVFMWQQYNDFTYEYQPFMDWLMSNGEVALTSGVGIFLGCVVLVVH